MLQGAQGRLKHPAFILRLPSARKPKLHWGSSRLRGHVNSKMHLMMHGTKLIIWQRPLPPPTTRVSVVFEMTCTVIRGYSVQSIQSWVSGTHFAGRNLRTRRKKIVSSLVFLLYIFLTFSAFFCRTGSGHGKETLPLLVREHKEEYCMLSQKEQEDLLEAFTDDRKTKATRLHVSTRSKVIDITQTMKAIENEVHARLNSNSTQRLM